MTAARSTHAERCCAPPAAPSRAAPARAERRIRAARGLLRALPAPLLTLADPAAAQLGYSLSIASEDRYRGLSVSDGRPIATGTVSWDDASGAYLGGSVSVGPTRDAGLRVTRLVQYAGYVHRLRSGLAIDVGVTNRIYSRHIRLEYARAFAQGYVGLVGRNLSARLSYAPDYDGFNGAAVYAEADALLFSRAKWSLSGHAGATWQGRSRVEAAHGPEIDLRLGVTRTLGRLALTASAVGLVPDHRGGPWRGTLVVAATRSF